MALIYQQARCAVIYLGEQRKGQERYMFFLLLLAKLVGDMFEASVDITRNNKCIKQALMEAFGSEDVAPIEDLTKLGVAG